MLKELQEMVKRIILECEDENALDAEDITYLEQIKTSADLMNFEDSNGDDKMHSLAMSAAKAIGQSAGWIAAMDRERYGSPALSSPTFDFGNSGLGIGGLGQHIEDLPIPSAAAVEQVQKKEANMETCRRCSQNDLFDGAMFTTMAGSGYCDDCC